MTRIIASYCRIFVLTPLMPGTRLWQNNWNQKDEFPLIVSLLMPFDCVRHFLYATSDRARLPELHKPTPESMVGNGSQTGDLVADLFHEAWSREWRKFLSRATNIKT
jgi:hypothetical protein